MKLTIKINQKLVKKKIINVYTINLILKVSRIQSSLKTIKSTIKMNN